MQQTIDRFTETFSTYDGSSEIQRLNRLQIGESTTVSTGMIRALQLAQQLCESSGGAFSPFYGIQMIEYGFEPDTIGNDHAIVPVAPEPCASIDLKGDVFTRRHEARLNLNAVAEGLLLDDMGLQLQNVGETRYLIEFGGEFLAGTSASARPQGWLVAVENVADTGDAKPYGTFPAIFEMQKAGLSTSGSHINVRGERSHLIDNNGRPIEKRKKRSASVLCTGSGAAALADGLATTAAVLGWQKSKQLMQSYRQCSLLFQDEEHIYTTTNWPPNTVQR